MVRNEEENSLFIQKKKGAVFIREKDLICFNY